MATTTISISADAHKLLKQLKQPGESYSDVILEYVRPPAETGGELLDRLRHIEPPIVDRELMTQVRAGRGRRSQRANRHAR
jgi:predicted CopG family antitoxin